MSRLFLLKSILLMGFVSAFAQYEDQPPQISKYQLSIDPVTHHVGLGRLGKSPKISFESFRQAEPQNLAEFMGIIEQQAPQLFDQAVLIHRSGSLQPSTPKEPRILLFGENLSLSFSTIPSQQNRVEILQFNNSRLDFSMHEIVFTEAGPLFNEKPKECSSCHGQQPKPVWEAYDFWPSAIGSQSGTTHSAQEKELLEWVQNTTHTHPVLNKVNKNTLKEAIDTFTAFLAHQNFLAAANKIKSDLQAGGELYPFRYAILGIMSCTDKSYGAGIEENIIFKDFIPEDLRNGWSISFDKVYRDVEISNKRVKDDLWVYYLRSFPGATFPNYPGLYRLRSNEIVQGSQLGYIFANLGFNLRDFTTSLREDSYIMSTPNLFDFDIQKNYLYFMPELIEEIDHEVRDIGGPDFQYFDFDCAQLKEKSMNALQNYSIGKSHRLQTASRPHKGMAPFGMCVTCHTRTPKPGEAETPYIPFDDTWALGQELASTDLKSKIVDRITREDIKQMPKDLPHLSKKQIESFISTLEKIEKVTRSQ